MATQPQVVAIAPSCRPCFGLDGRHSPFTWYSPVLTLEDCTVVEDKLGLLGTPWAVLVNRLHAAYSYYCNRHFDKGRALLAECYIALLPLASCDTGCGIIQDHREALRHVLDATWAAMGQLERTAQCLHQDPDASWRAFTNTITMYNKLERKQQAAVVAIRGTLESSPELLRKAIALSPNEGEWRYKLGYLLEEERGGHPPCKEELATLRRAVELRANPDTLTRLARSLAGTGPAGVAEAAALFEDAMLRFPDNVRVLWLYGCISSDLYGGEVPAGRSNKALMRRCIQMGGRSAYALFKLGVMHIGEKGNKAVEYFDQALQVNRVATASAQRELCECAKQLAEERDAKEAAGKGGPRE